MTDTPPPDIVRIKLPTPFPVGKANAFLIKSDPPILVDAGTRVDGAYDELAARLEENGLRVADIGIVFVTHGHLDHIGLLADIAAESHAEIYAHPYVVSQFGDYDKSAKESAGFIETTMRRLGVPEDMTRMISDIRASLHSLAARVTIQHPMEDGDSVAGFTVCHVPGHSATDVVFYHPEWRVAFTGDHVLKGVTPNPLIRKPPPGRPPTKCLLEYQQSLRRTHALDIDTCYPGHGSPFSNHRAIIDNLFERHDRRTEEVRTILRDGPLTPYEIVMRLFPKLRFPMLHPGLSVAVGHIEVLEGRGETVSEENDGVVRYALVNPA